MEGTTTTYPRFIDGKASNANVNLSKTTVMSMSGKTDTAGTEVTTKKYKVA
jgi:hypothetical protein